MEDAKERVQEMIMAFAFHYVTLSIDIMFAKIKQKQSDESKKSLLRMRGDFFECPYNEILHPIP